MSEPEPVRPFWCAHRPKCVSQVEHDWRLDQYIREVERRRPETFTERVNRWADRIAWTVVVVALAYFTLHVIWYLIR